MRRISRSLLWVPLVLSPVSAARAQWMDVVVDPALGSRPSFGPGGFLSNGNGYGASGPRGYGYYTGLYLPPNDLGNGPSPYFSPIYPAMAGMQRGPASVGAPSTIRPTAPQGGSRPAPRTAIGRWFRRMGGAD